MAEASCSGLPKGGKKKSKSSKPSGREGVMFEGNFYDYEVYPKEAWAQIAKHGKVIHPMVNEDAEKNLELNNVDAKAQESKEIENRCETWQTASHQETIVIIGTGDMAKGLLICLIRRGYRVVVGSRNPDKNRSKIECLGGELKSYKEALNEGKIVLIAIPFEGFESLPADLFREKIVVDVSNKSTKNGDDGPSLADQLQKHLPGSKVVKAFNTLSVYELQKNLFQNSKEVPICSDYDDAKLTITAIIRNIGLVPVDRGSLLNATEIEDIPLTFFQEWRLAGKLALAVFSVTFIVEFFRSQLCRNFQRPENKDWDWSLFDKLPLVTTHASAAATALILLTSCYLPGVIAAYLQLYRGTKYSLFPKWLDNWLRSRKQIGLAAYAFASMHTLMAVIDVIRRGMTEWRDFSYTTFGCFAIGLMTILAITSLPSVSKSLTWREFSFVQRYLGWWALFLSVIHLVFKKWHKLVMNYQRCVILPDWGQITIVFALLTLLLKLILMLPCIDKQVQKIRRGHERKSIPQHPA